MKQTKKKKKHRIFAAFLCVCILFGAAPNLMGTSPVYAAAPSDGLGGVLTAQVDETRTSLLSAREIHRHAVSVGCEQDAGTQITFVPLEKTSGGLSAGNYYLTEDMTVGDPSALCSLSGTVNLCLNGHTLSGRIGAGTGNHNGVFNICDCAGGGLIESQGGITISQVTASTWISACSSKICCT